MADKLKSEDEDKPDFRDSQEAKILWSLDGLIDAEGPIMVTSWVIMVEYVDKYGETHLSPLCSDMPQWRMTGIIDSSREMLNDDYALLNDWDEPEE